jgi:hypothetical protein
MHVSRFDPNNPDSLVFGFLLRFTGRWPASRTPAPAETAGSG